MVLYIPNSSTSSPIHILPMSNVNKLNGLAVLKIKNDPEIVLDPK